MNVPLYLVDAFTTHPFGGNPAGVATRAEGLTTEQMQAIARELKQSETCFVTEGPETGVDFRLRWFTPSVEVDLCGHATVAAYTCLAREGRIRFLDGEAQLKHATRRGILGVWVRGEGEQTRSVMMSAGVAPIQPAADNREEVARAIGLESAAIDFDLPLASDASGARLIVPVRELRDLLSLVPDSDGMCRYGKRAGYTRFTLVCQETQDPTRKTHLRHFAPANGVPEDPVTGTAHAAIAVYLDHVGLLPRQARLRYEGEQGHAVGRPGSVQVEVLRDEAGVIIDVRVGGSAVIVVQGEITV